MRVLKCISWRNELYSVDCGWSQVAVSSIKGTSTVHIRRRQIILAQHLRQNSPIRWFEMPSCRIRKKRRKGKNKNSHFLRNSRSIAHNARSLVSLAGVS